MMEKVLFHDLYKRLNTLEIHSCSPETLSGLLHGYLTVYSMVRVYPWLEDDFGAAGEIHERAKGIARLYPCQLENGDVPADTRAGYAADLMDVYQVYSDLGYLKTGLDGAYRILAARGDGRLSLPCRTPNVCRMLCDCYYFAGDEDCGKLAGQLVTEVLGYTQGGARVDLLSWWEAICLYDDAVGRVELPLEERERLSEERSRLSVRVRQMEDTLIDQFCMEEDTSRVTGQVFHILAKREFAACNTEHGKKG